MSTELKMRRGSTANHAGFTGAAGELTIDTTKKTAVVHDGATAGGTPLAKETHVHAASDITSGTVATARLGSGTANSGSFLRGDQTWTGLVGVTDGDKGDITVSSSGAAWTIDAGSVTYAKMQDVSATSRIMGRITAGAGDMEELTGTQATTLLDTFTSSLKGLAPASGGGTSNFLRADGTWAAPAGGGDALTTNPLSQFAATTSAQLRGVLSDETGTGLAVFNDSPTLITPALGVASATSINKVAITAPATGSTLTIANGQTLTVNGSATITNGTHSGTNTGDQTSVTGNAGTVTVADAGGDTTCWVLLGTSQTGNLSPATDAGLTYNATTDALTATTFIGALTGNASTATALATGRTINGTTFDGTANITITAAAGTLTGTTLNSSVVTSSLTAVGTITTGVWTGTAIAVANGGTGATTAGTARTNLGVAIGSDVQAYNANALKRQITVTIGDGTNVPAVNTQVDTVVPYGCTITKATMLADASGSAVINVWKDSYANYPPTVADKITASAPPTLSSAIKSQDSTLTGWTTSITAGDTIRFNLDSVTTCKRITLVLEVVLT